MTGTWLGDWNMAGLFSHSVGNVIIPTDELIFFRGVGFRGVETTNQITMILPIQMATFFSPLFFSQSKIVGN